MCEPVMDELLSLLSSAGISSRAAVGISGVAVRSQSSSSNPVPYLPVPSLKISVFVFTVKTCLDTWPIWSVRLIKMLEI